MRRPSVSATICISLLPLRRRIFSSAIMEAARPLQRSITRLSAQKVQVNVTAMMTLGQVRHVVEVLHEETLAVVSVFAGRIADTGVDPVPLMREAVRILESRPKAELLWASPRELLNIFHADEVGCHIITVTHDLLGKLKGVGKDLDQFSLETVQMFYDDASAAGYTITTDKKAATSG